MALVGFMGSGKTLVSNRLAQLSGKDVVSTDALIEAKESRSINEIFRDSGEAYFRKIEKDIVRDVSLQKNVVIDCGGGVVLDDDNIRNLKTNAVLIHLEASPDEIWARVKEETHRPLLQVDDPLARIRDLLTARQPFYNKADRSIPTDGKSIDEVCEDIMRQVGHD